MDKYYRERHTFRIKNHHRLICRQSCRAGRRHRFGNGRNHLHCHDFHSTHYQSAAFKKYVFGYEKAEGIATKILSLVIFYAGVQMLISSIGSIFTDENKEIPSAIAIYVTIFSIIGKLLLASYQYKQGKKIDSSMLTANAINMRNDVIISSGVLLGLIFTFIFKLPILDSITGLIISLFIIKSSISIFIDSNVELMDGVKKMSMYIIRYSKRWSKYPVRVIHTG